METILRRKEMAEIKLLPVRHHSPACAWQVRRMIEKWRPQAVLIEGPVLSIGSGVSPASQKFLSFPVTLSVTLKEASGVF